MKTFHCDACDALAFFENVRCLTCSEVLAFVPAVLDVCTLRPDDQRPELGLFTSGDEKTSGQIFRPCKNATDHEICNWVLAADDPHEYCESCRLTRTIPDLSIPGNLQLLQKMETAKRRLIFTLMSLGLPVFGKDIDPVRGLVYEFKADLSVEGGEPVLTGHDEGVITMNLAEDDDAERERRRQKLNEPYRTLIGHFRHEVGHYYWDLLVQESKWSEPCRAMFGDEREDYEEALKKHYENGAPADWPSNFVSSYATMHPWEDWAETWAHYLHIVDTLETAAACGFALMPARPNEPALTLIDEGQPGASGFDLMIDRWIALTYALNSLNRSLGHADAYPFVLTPPVIEKLRFVHDVIADAATSNGQHGEVLETLEEAATA